MLARVGAGKVKAGSYCGISNSTVCPMVRNSPESGGAVPGALPHLKLGVFRLAKGVTAQVSASRFTLVPQFKGEWNAATHNQLSFTPPKLAKETVMAGTGLVDSRVAVGAQEPNVVEIHILANFGLS